MTLKDMLRVCSRFHCYLYVARVIVLRTATDTTATRKIITTRTHCSIILNILVFTTLVILHMYTTTLPRSLCPFIHRLEFCARPSGIIRSSFPLFRPENAHKSSRCLRSKGDGRSDPARTGRAIEGGKRQRKEKQKKQK